jgi:hypothetical protein
VRIKWLDHGFLKDYADGVEGGIADF